MSLDDVTAQAIAGPQRALEVDTLADLPVSHGGAIERGHDGRHGEPMGAEIAHGEARALAGNAFTRNDVVVATGDPKFAPCFGVAYLRNRPDVIHKPGEHQAASVGRSSA